MGALLMIDDYKLAQLMDSIDQHDKVQLAEMLKEMSAEDVAYFKGYVQGYSTAAMHLQEAWREKDSLE